MVTLLRHGAGGRCCCRILVYSGLEKIKEVNPASQTQGMFWEDLQNFLISQEVLDQRTMMLGLGDSQGFTL